MRSHRAVPTRLARTSIAVGVAVALVAVGCGVLFGLSRPERWTAESQAVVLPSSELSDTTSADYYETLSRGQIPATFAEVLNDDSYVSKAEMAVGTSAEERRTVQVDAVVVPNTALISVSVTASSPRLAEELANQLVRHAVGGTRELAKPYALSQVSNGYGTAVRDGLSTTQYVLLAVFLGVLAGVATQQLFVQVGLARRRNAEHPPTSSLVEMPPAYGAANGVRNGAGVR